MNILKSFTGVDIADIVNTTVTTIASKFKTPITPAQQIQMEKDLMDFLSKEDTAQTEVNKAEASNTNLFVSGWRPFVGWTCALAFALFALSTVVFPIAKIFQPVLIIPEIEWQLMLEVLFGILGLGGLRTYEKKHGVA
jgi:antitoxin component of RelBE/YafQ-DinJ toxin-antitoxin module